MSVHEQRRIGWLFLGIAGFLMFFAGLGSLGMPDKGPALTFIGIAALCVFLTIRGFRNRLSRTFELMLATAAGEVQATTATDGDAIQELRDVIEARIAAKP